MSGSDLINSSNTLMRARWTERRLENYVKLEPKSINIDLEPFIMGVDIGKEMRELRKIEKNRFLPKKYILNENACICFWKDNTKTVSVKHKEDKFDKTMGFLMCCYQHYNSNLSRNKRKKVLSWIKQENVKEYLMDMFINKNNMTVKEADAYLNNLKVDKKQHDKILTNNGKHMKDEIIGELKVGDKIQIKKSLRGNTKCGSETFVTSMEKYKGSVLTIAHISGNGIINIMEDNNSWKWTKEMFEIGGKNG